MLPRLAGVRHVRDRLPWALPNAHMPAPPRHLLRSIKTSSGVLAVISLDASGGAARQRVLIVGDQSRCQLAGKASASDLQIVSL